MSSSFVFMKYNNTILFAFQFNILLFEKKITGYSKCIFIV